jgi:hypothetical protein
MSRDEEARREAKSAAGSGRAVDEEGRAGIVNVSLGGTAEGK